MAWRSLLLLLGTATAISFSGCSFDFDRERTLAPGDVGGRALREGNAPAPYARAHIAGTGREYRTRADGSFEVHGLVPGGFSLGLVDDSNGDGWPERSARRTFTIRRAPHASGLFGASEPRATFVALGDVVLEGIVEASGRVLREDGSAVVGARVFAHRSVSLPVSDEGAELEVEQAADAETATDSDGAFAFPALPAGTLSFVAFAGDGAELLASEPAQQEASPGDDLEIELRVSAAAPARRVHVELVPVPAADDLVRVHVVAPGHRPELLGVGDYQLGENDVSAGSSRLELDVPLGAWDVWVETQSGRFGVLRRQVASRPGREALTWGLLLLGPQDACAAKGEEGQDIRDCDQDTLQGLPPLLDLDDPSLSSWRGCAPACEHAFGEAALGASCTVAGEIYDCDDDGDGQADVTESISCYGLGRGNDPDGDGLCGGDDPYPQCRENDPAHERCKAGATLLDFPPSLRPELAGEETDAGPDDSGSPLDAGAGDAGDEQDGGLVDAGLSDAGPPETPCESEADCSAEQVCHPLLGVCAPDCDLDEVCAGDEICTPGAGGYFCAPDCRAFVGACGSALCGSDGMCSRGKAPTHGVYGDTWIWDGATRAWSFKTTVTNPRPRTRHVLAPNGDGVVMLGGQDHDGVASLLSAPLVFSDGNWTSRGSDFLYGETLVFAAAAGVASAGSGSFYTYGVVTQEVGGYDLFAELPCCGASLYYLDVGVPEVGRTRAAMAHDGEGRVWLFGGRNDDGVLDDTWVFDSNAAFSGWQLAEVILPPGARYDHAFSYAGIPGAMLLSGGRQADGGLLQDTWRLSYDEVSGAVWTLLPDAAFGPRAGHGMSWDGAQVVVYGGATSRARTSTRDVLIFDEVTDVWTSPRLSAVAPPPRTLVRMSYDGSGSVVSYGGELGPTPVHLHGSLIAGTTDAASVPGSVDWSVLGESARPTDGAAFATAPDGALWVFGGRDALGALTRQLLVYGPGGSVTDLTDPVAGPSAREGASLAFHPSTGALFLFGGQDHLGAKGDLYRWNETNVAFELIFGTGLQPSPRAFASAAPSVPDDAILLFGGEEGGITYDDFWLLGDDGTFSTPLVGNLRPQARSEAAMTATAAGVYLYGGFGFPDIGTATTFSDLWHWNGSELSLLLAEGTPALAGATLSAEPGSSRLWLVGGNDGSASSSATYYVDVSDPSLVVPVELGVEPLLRSRHAAGFVAGELLLVGGSDEVRDLSSLQRAAN